MTLTLHRLEGQSPQPCAFPSLDSPGSELGFCRQRIVINGFISWRSDREYKDCVSMCLFCPTGLLVLRRQRICRQAPNAMSHLSHHYPNPHRSAMSSSTLARANQVQCQLDLGGLSQLLLNVGAVGLKRFALAGV